MISTVRGIVQQIWAGEMVVEVGGVGLRVLVPRSVVESVASVGNVVFLYTHLVVREDALTLFGFGSREQRELFELLLQVSGIGPKLALAVISNVRPEALRAALQSLPPDAPEQVEGRIRLALRYFARP